MTRLYFLVCLVSGKLSSWHAIGSPWDPDLDSFLDTKWPPHYASSLIPEVEFRMGSYISCSSNSVTSGTMKVINSNGIVQNLQRRVKATELMLDKFYEQQKPTMVTACNM
jgi:hypothetical protein